MSMVIKTNMDSVRTFNMMYTNTALAHKHLMKVSTGMKVRDAQDDAAAYAISEKMRVRIRALEQAHSNTQNGSNMMKTAEGAVSNIIDTLKTLKEKAINAANDSNSDEERRMIQKEFDQLVDQIDDDALITFNNKYLIDNTRNNTLFATHEVLVNQNLAQDTTRQTAFSAMKTRNGESLGIKDTDTVAWSYVANGKTYHGAVKGNATFESLNQSVYSNTPDNQNLFVLEGGDDDATDDDSTATNVLNDDKFGNAVSGERGTAYLFLDEYDVNKQVAGFTLQVLDSTGNVNKFATAQLQFKEAIRGESQTGDQALSFHVGAEANFATKFALTDMRTVALGLRGAEGDIISISTKEDANAAINVLTNVLEKVLDQQSTIGSAISRMEHTATNLTTAYTDDQASESVIRDADMATEMAGYLKYNVLTQASQAMLAQANQNPLNVLALIGGQVGE